MYVIKKTINNNVVLVNDSRFSEFIVFGPGVGYNKKKDDILDEDKVEKIFGVYNDEQEYLLEYLNDVDYNLISICEHIVKKVEEEYEIEYTGYMFLSLLDHLNNAIERHRNNVVLTADLTILEINMYKSEKEIAHFIGDLISKEFNITLTEDEFVFIMLHFVSQLTEISFTESSHNIVKIIDDILNSIEKNYQGYLDSTFFKKRLIRHLQYFLIRHYKDEQEINNDLITNELFETMKKNYPKSYVQLLEIIQIFNNYKIDVNESEKMYLLVHLVKIIRG